MSPDRRLTTDEVSDIRLILQQQDQMDKKLTDQGAQNTEILRRLSAIDTALALGSQRMDQIDHHIEATDTQVAAVKAKTEETRVPYTGIIAFAAAVGNWIATLSGKHP